MENDEVIEMEISRRKIVENTHFNPLREYEKYVNFTVALSLALVRYFEFSLFSVL